MVKLFTGFILAASCLCVSAISHATVVVHSLKEQVEGWSTTVEASYSSSSTTVDKKDYKGEFRLSHNSDQRQWLLFGDMSYSDVNGNTSEDSKLIHGRYIHKKAIAGLNVEVFAQQERDDFALLASRRLYGAGLAMLKKHERYSVHTLLGVMDEREEHLTDPDQHQALTRLTLSSQIQYQLENQARLTAVVYYQPAASDLANYRSTFRASLAFPLTEQLDLKVGYAWRYNGEAFTDVPPIKRSFTTGVSYHF